MKTKYSKKGIKILGKVGLSKLEKDDSLKKISEMTSVDFTSVESPYFTFSDFSRIKRTYVYVLALLLVLLLIAIALT